MRSARSHVVVRLCKLSKEVKIQGRIRHKPSYMRRSYFRKMRGAINSVNDLPSRYHARTV